MKKRKWIALAGLALMVPLSDIFAQKAANTNTPPSPWSSPTWMFTSSDSLSWMSQLDPSFPSQNTRTLIAYLENSGAHGLNPETYKTSEIKELIKSGAVRWQDQDRFQNLLTEALVRYAQDMTGPRVNTGSPTSYWRKAMTRDQVIAQYKATKNIDQVLTALAPKSPLYTAMQSELERLKTLPTDSIEPGSKLTNAQKSAQIIVNLERLRWDKDRPDRYIEVNIASQSLIAVDSSKTVIESKLIVGETKPEYRTHEQVLTIDGARFNPTWHVPASLIVSRVIPDLLKDPHYTEKKHINIYYDGKLIAASSINWKKVTPQQLRHIKMDQPPSEKNSLGYVRALMDSPYDQYLHYTNAPDLFQKEQRFFSSGCMRMEKPILITSFILSLPQSEIERRIKNGKEVDVKAKQPLAFFSVYHTITLNADGTLKFHPDAYGRDRELLKALKDKQAIPQTFENSVVKAPPPPPSHPAM